jgi:hypothetical protein
MARGTSNMKILKKSVTMNSTAHSAVGFFSAVPGTLFVVVLELKGDFKLYRATGLMIIIVIGDESSQLSRHNNTQAFWIDANQLSIQRTYRFTTFTAWENRESATPSGTAALEIPQPKRKSTD